jgi:iron complex transport system substrate-binding protein
MKKTILLLLFTFIFCGLSVLSGSARTITVTDMSGREVKTPFDPERIICIGPGTLRLIVYLQAESKVVGVEDMEKMNPRGRPYWLTHPELSKLPRCGPGGPASINKKPDLEAVISVKPQVIFITYMDASLAEEVEKTLRIPVVVLSYGRFATFDETVYDALGIAGRILDRQQRAKDIVNYIESQRKEMDSRTQSVPVKSRPKVYVGGIGYRGAHGLESTEQDYAPLDWIGAINVAKQVPSSINSHVFMDKEILLKLNPEYIFIDAGGLPLVKTDYLKKKGYYNSLQAFAQKQVYILHPFNFYTTNIGTALADAWAMGKILYKDRFKDIDIKQKAHKIYTYLVGQPVYQEMRKDYGQLGKIVTFLNEFRSKSHE